MIIDAVNFYREKSLIQNQTIEIRNGLISSVVNSSASAATDLLVPGFIDLQIYGGGGKLFSAEPTVESLCIMEDDLMKKGTTGFLACMATNSLDVFRACIAAAKEHRANARNFLGLHLEGPYMNPKRLGAHIPEFVHKASLDEVKSLLDFGDGVIRMMTLAPEVQDDDVINYLLDNDVVVSLGHSDATFDEATAAYNLGIQTTTHLFNAMSPIHHRAPGIPSAVFSHQKALASIIADGQHVAFEVLKFAHKILKDRLFLITDAVTPCNIGPYQHIFQENKFVMPDGTLSGSAVTMLQSVKNCIEYCDIKLPEALQMATYIPAKLIGMEALTGQIALEHQANLLVLDQQLNIKKIIFNGIAQSN